MRTDKPYTLSEVVLWTRRTIYALLALSIVPAVLYRYAGFTWLTIPWDIVFFLGLTVALSAAFKLFQTYGRAQEAEQLWSAIVGHSRIWGGMCRDLVDDPAGARDLVYRHFAWLAALRHQLRGAKSWETTKQPENVEYARNYRVEERENSLQDDIARYVGPEDAADILSSRSKALEVLNLQSRETRRLVREGHLTPSGFADMHASMRHFQEQQSRAERIKNTPYPRQYGFIHTLFIRILYVTLPLGILGEFASLDSVVSGWAVGNMIWLGVLVSVLLSWMYASLDHVCDNTANPFEGGPNDVPITRICESIEKDLRDMLGEVEVPPRSREEVIISL